MGITSSGILGKALSAVTQSLDNTIIKAIPEEYQALAKKLTEILDDIANRDIMELITDSLDIAAMYLDKGEENSAIKVLREALLTVETMGNAAELLTIQNIGSDYQEPPFVNADGGEYSEEGGDLEESESESEDLSIPPPPPRRDNRMHATRSVGDPSLRGKLNRRKTIKETPDSYLTRWQSAAAIKKPSRPLDFNQGPWANSN